MNNFKRKRGSEREKEQERKRGGRREEERREKRGREGTLVEWTFAPPSMRAAATSTWPWRQQKCNAV